MEKLKESSLKKADLIIASAKDKKKKQRKYNKIEPWDLDYLVNDFILFDTIRPKGKGSW